MSNPSGLGFVAGALTQAQNDFRYVRRFVTVAGVPVLAGNTRTGTNNVPETEAILENPNGPVHGRIPQDASAALMGAGAVGAGDGGRFGTRLRILRPAAAAANISLTSFGGTYQAPTQLGAVAIGGVYGEGFDNANAIQTIAALEFIARAAITPTAAAGLVRVRTPEVGSATLREIVRFQAGGAAIAESIYTLATARLIGSGGSLAVRNPGNTVNVVEVNATGLGFFNVAPVARPNITGARGGNAALASLLTNGALLGLWTDGTTA